MIDRTHPLPITRQAHIVNISRGSVYYESQPVSEADLRLMRRIDELHLELPFAGTRMLRDLLRAEGFEVGRKHMTTLMRRMGITALYRKPNTSNERRGRRSTRTCCARWRSCARTTFGRWTSATSRWRGASSTWRP